MVELPLLLLVLLPPLPEVVTALLTDLPEELACISLRSDSSSPE
jgi:hypothetical protein